MVRHNPNAWRWGLDPRDPDYDDPPETLEGQEDIDEGDDDPIPDPFDDPGPYHYIPPGDR